MTTKEKAASPSQGQAAQQKTLDSNNSPNNPLLGWIDLSASSKESRNKRRQKRSWKRG